MRILAIDYGEKRLGLAISDELAMMVRPLVTLLRVPKEKCFAQIKNYVEELEVSKIVIGLPLRLDGTKGDAALKVEKFISELSLLISCPIITWNEQLTSHEAEERMKQRGLNKTQRQAQIDQFAALIILEDYLSNNSLNTSLD
ncbi:putative pre-16S rRNA nuclease [subsurface metagenome]